MNADTDNYVAIREVDGIFHVNADGTAGTTSLSICYGRTTCRFFVKCPDYIDAKGVVQGNTEEEAIQNYQQACEEYQRQRLKPDAKPMLAVNLGQPSFAALGFQASLLLGYGEVFAMPEGTVYERDGDGIGRQVMRGVREILVADTPEVRAKLDALIASINVASGIVRGLEDALVPETYLLAITDNVSSVQADQPEPQPAVVPEDDEL